MLRGRIDIAQQVRRNLARPDRLHCRFDEFTADNPLNRVLKAALRALLRIARGQSTARSVAELLFCFADVGDVDGASIDWASVKLDRLSRRYEPLVRMARMFLDGASPDVVSGNGVGFALLFDMNELFEAYVGRQAIRAFRPLGFDVRLQGPKRHLALDSEGAGAFELRPDIIVTDTHGTRFVLDTKWKRLQEGASREAVSSGDLYQMHAYAHRYEAQEVVLVYPHHVGLGPWVARRAEFGLMDGAGAVSRRVSVATVDLTELGKVRDGLIRMLALASNPAGECDTSSYLAASPIRAIA